MPTQQPSLFDLNQIKALNPDKDVIYIPPTTDMIKVYTEAVVHSLNRKTIPSDDFEDVFEREFRNFVTVITRIHAKHLSKGESYEKQKGTTRSDTA